MFKTAMVFIAFLVVASCASTAPSTSYAGSCEPRPAWVDQPTREFPVAGVGSAMLELNENSLGQARSAAMLKAKEEIARMNSQAAQYVAEVSKLREENELLAANNSELLQKNESLTLQYQNEQRAKQEIEEARAVLAAEKERLAKTNEELDVKVDMANAIKINFMKTQGYKVDDKGKRKKKKKAKDINVIEVCFTTETNMVTAAGPKEFQIRLIDPLGETVAREDMGSGILTNKLDNTQVRYTTSGIIQYNNEDTEGCIEWSFTDRLPKGLYDVEIYNNGFNVGKGDFKMK